MSRKPLWLAAGLFPIPSLSGLVAFSSEPSPIWPAFWSREKVWWRCEGIEANLPRALRILDTLFLALDQEPFRLSWPEGSDARLTISVLDDTFRFAISEIIQYKRHRPTSRERLHQKQNWAFRPRKSDYKLTGRLRLEIDGVQGKSGATTPGLTDRGLWRFACATFSSRLSGSPRI